jgi:GNAT superfamily N-acetyltransferase
MSGDLTIRFVTRQDYAQWLPLWEGYNAFYGRSGPTALAPEITAMTWARFFDAYEPVHALVAESGGELVGLTHYLFHRSTTMIEPNCYLQDLFTGAAARGMGVGRALINGVYEQAKLAGFPASTGRRTKPTTPRCSFMTRWRSVPASSFTASCSDTVS